MPGQRARDPDELARPLGQLVGHRVHRPVEVDKLQDLCRVSLGAVLVFASFSEDWPGGRHSNVLANLEVIEQIGVLPRPRQPAAGSLVCRQAN